MVAFAPTTVPTESCSRDPVEYQDDENIYSYVRNLSLSDIDPTGMCKARLVKPLPGGTKVYFDQSGKKDGYTWVGNLLYGVFYNGEVQQFASDESLIVKNKARMSVKYVGWVRPSKKTIEATATLSCTAYCTPNDFIGCIGHVDCKVDVKPLTKQGMIANPPYGIDVFEPDWFSSFGVIAGMKHSKQADTGPGMSVEWRAPLVGYYNSEVTVGVSAWEIGFEKTFVSEDTFFIGNPNETVVWECCKAKSQK